MLKHEQEERVVRAIQDTATAARRVAEALVRTERIREWSMLVAAEEANNHPTEELKIYLSGLEDELFGGPMKRRVIRR